MTLLFLFHDEVEVETNVPIAKQLLLFEGKALANNQRLDAAGIATIIHTFDHAQSHALSVF